MLSVKKGAYMTGPALKFSNEREELRGRARAHMPGFGGHFATKRPRDSTTLWCFPQVRWDWRNRRLVTTVVYPERAHVDRHDEHRPAADKDDENRILALGHCQYRRRPHSGREGVYGRSIAHDLAEARRMARQTVNEEES